MTLKLFDSGTPIMVDGDSTPYYWAELGSCWELGLQIPMEQNPFFREGKGSTYDEARAYCAGCPVVVDCLIDGIDEEAAGFRGGMSPNERAEVRRSVRRGKLFRQAVESVWARHRRGGRNPVPPKQVWSEWYD